MSGSLFNLEGSFDNDIDVTPNSIEIADKKVDSINVRLTPTRLNFFNNFIDSFKRETQSEFDSNIDNASQENLLKHSIKTRHIMAISLGTGIGTGLLVGTGPVLAQAGPLGLIIGYLVASLMIIFMIQAAGELAVVYSNLVGNFISYPSFLVDPAFGFAMAMIYTLQWCLVLPLQLVTAAITLTYWKELNKINLDYFVLIFLVLTISINLFGGVMGYVETEFACNICKILLIIGFIILGIFIICGAAGETKEYIGGKYWRDPGSLANGFKGIASVFCYAAFSYGGIEIIVLTAAEQKNPVRSIPGACKKVIYRVLLIYILPLIIVGLLVPYNDPHLLTTNISGDENNKSAGSKSSPFVIAVQLYGIKVVPDIINFGILISVLSVANSALYSAPRLLLSMSNQGTLPKKLNYVDKRGRPLICFGIVLIFSLIGFVGASDIRDEVFIWLLAISGLSQVFIWLSICISHIRFRSAVNAQGYNLNKLKFKSKTGIVGSWIAIVLSLFILVCQFWVAISPVNNNSSNNLDVKFFFQNYLAFPIILVLYFGHKAFSHKWSILIPASNIDLTYNSTLFNNSSHNNSTEEHQSVKIKNKFKDDEEMISLNEFINSEICASPTTAPSAVRRIGKQVYGFWC